jgi:formate dehydrogenase subunit gamma
MASKTGNLILRHPVGERVTHWAVAIVFIFLFLSGLAMFHPFFFWLSRVFGNGQFMRFLHPIAGAALVLLFYPARHIAGSV